MSDMMEVVPLDEVYDALHEGKAPSVVDTSFVAAMIADRLMGIKDLDELFDPEGTNATGKRLNQPFTLRSVLFMPSDVPNPDIPVYAIIDGVDDDGVPFVMSCGGRSVLIQLFRWASQSGKPRYVRLVERGQQKGTRNRPLYLEDVRKPAPAGK